MWPPFSARFLSSDRTAFSRGITLLVGQIHTPSSLSQLSFVVSPARFSLLSCTNTPATSHILKIPFFPLRLVLIPLICSSKMTTGDAPLDIVGVEKIGSKPRNKEFYPFAFSLLDHTKDDYCWACLGETVKMWVCFSCTIPKLWTSSTCKDCKVAKFCSEKCQDSGKFDHKVRSLMPSGRIGLQDVCVAVYCFSYQKEQTKTVVETEIRFCRAKFLHEKLMVKWEKRTASRNHHHHWAHTKTRIFFSMNVEASKSARNWTLMNECWSELSGDTKLVNRRVIFATSHFRISWRERTRLSKVSITTGRVRELSWRFGNIVKRWKRMQMQWKRSTVRLVLWQKKYKYLFRDLRQSEGIRWQRILDWWRNCIPTPLKKFY